MKNGTVRRSSLVILGKCIICISRDLISTFPANLIKNLFIPDFEGETCRGSSMLSPSRPQKIPGLRPDREGADPALKFYIRQSFCYHAFHKLFWPNKSKLTGVKLGKRGLQNHFLTATAKAVA